MRLNRLLVAMSAAGLLATVGPAQASITFKFNPTGSGLPGNVISGAGLIDQAPGNANALNGAGPPGPPVPKDTVITDLYQANLGAVQALSTAPLFSNGTGGNFFTFVASFTEKVIASSFIPLGGGTFIASNVFLVNGGGTFKMCKQLALGNNLTGVGFGCAGNGILSGTINGGNSTQTAFVFGALPDLDKAGANDWPGVTTLGTTGAATLSATITFVDALYFPDLKVGYNIAVNSSLITPYDQVDPSQSFSSLLSGLSTNDHVTDIGTKNGIDGPNFVFQSDANSSFDVPEPGALALGGIALAGLALLRSRRKQSV